MIEVEVVANRLGIELPVSIGQHIASAEKVGERLEAPTPPPRTVCAWTKLLDGNARGGRK